MTNLKENKSKMMKKFSILTDLKSHIFKNAIKDIVYPKSIYRRFNFG